MRMRNNDDSQNQKRASNFRTAMSQIVNGATTQPTAPTGQAAPTAPSATPTTPATPVAPTPTTPATPATPAASTPTTPATPAATPAASSQTKASSPLAGLTEQIKMHERQGSTPTSTPDSSAFAARKYSSMGSNLDSKARSKTVLAEDFEVNGDVKATGDIEINGIVNGNVTTEGHIQLLGTITGSVTAASANFESGKLTGDTVEVQNNISIGRDFELSAQVTAQNIDIDGKVNGNITVAASTTLRSHAKVRGDITSADLSIEKGASLSGTIKVNE